MKLSLTKLVLVGAVLSTGCGSWLQDFKNNPAQQVANVEQIANVAVEGAKLAWVAILPNLPKDKQSDADQQFQNAVAAVAHAEQALNSALNAALETQDPHPNFADLVKNLDDAVQQVLKIVDLYNGSRQSGAPTKVGAGAEPRGLADAKASAALLDRMVKR